MTDPSRASKDALMTLKLREASVKKSERISHQIKRKADVAEETSGLKVPSSSHSSETAGDVAVRDPCRRAPRGKHS